eukprot:Rhum_TRINITY_DN14666_c18_g1::Rhum_TRINITY_DN14666_c18_g1_i1::g.107284::m.107284
MSSCVSCGTPAPVNGAAFCWRCGWKLTPPASIAVAPQPPPDAASSAAEAAAAAATASAFSAAAPPPTLRSPSELPRAVPPPPPPPVAAAVPATTPVSSNHSPTVAVDLPLAVQVAPAIATPAPLLPLPLPLPVEAASAAAAAAAALFGEIDVRSQGFVTLDDFRATLTKCRVRLAAAEVTELFRRADADGDTVLCYGEFEALCREHLSLAKLVHARTRVFWEDAELAQQIEAAKENLRRLCEERDAVDGGSAAELAASTEASASAADNAHHNNNNDDDDGTAAVSAARAA